MPLIFLSGRKCLCLHFQYHISEDFSSLSDTWFLQDYKPLDQKFIQPKFIKIYKFGNHPLNPFIHPGHCLKKNMLNSTRPKRDANVQVDLEPFMDTLWVANEESIQWSLQTLYMVVTISKL